MALLKLNVTPNASRNALLGWQGGALKLAVTAAPDNGRANAAVIRLLAGELGLAKSAIQIQSGPASPHKTLVINNLDDGDLRSRLDKLLK